MGGSIPRVDVLGVGISAVTVSSTIEEITRWVEEREQHYVCVTGVHGVMESQRDARLRAIHNASGLTVPDGMPMVWCAHWAGAGNVERVCGPDFMLPLLERARDRGWTVFFYGGAEGVPERLAKVMRHRFPGLEVVGTLSPPFRPLTEAEDEEVVATINAADPDLLFVGLSTPKQERWMAEHVERVKARAILGVGAAFDVHTGRTKRAPRWMQRVGLEWAFRLLTEPRRLWRRYLRNNPAFVIALLRRRPSWRR